MQKFEQIKGPKLIILALLPGIIITIIYILLMQIPSLKELPNMIAFSIAGIIGATISELGIVLYQSKKLTGTYSISKVIGLNSKLTKKDMFLYVFLLLIFTIVLFMVMQPIGNWLQKNIFAWIPNWFILSDDYNMYSKGTALMTVGIVFIFIVILVPIIEEIYFRGFLMPRMKWLGKYTVISNVTLFVAYHFWSPWQIIVRLIGCLPVYYFVYKKNSLKLGIFVHCLLNFLGNVLLVLPLILK